MPRLKVLFLQAVLLLPMAYADDLATNLTLMNNYNLRQNSDIWSRIRAGFKLNHDETSRKLVDGMYGFTIVDYILTCRNDHDANTCVRNTDAGGCFVCEYMLGMELKGIKNIEKLHEQDEAGNEFVIEI